MIDDETDLPYTAPAPPVGLRTTGQRFWSDVVRQWQLRPDELVMLRTACRFIDELEVMEQALDEQGVTVEGSRHQMRCHPLVTQIREHRIALARVLGTAGIGIAEATAGGAGAAKSNAGRALALARWNG